MKRTLRRTFVPLALAAGLLLPVLLYAEEKDSGHTGTWLKVAMTTDGKYSRDEKTVFAADAPAVYVVYRVVAAGRVSLRVVFWADAVEGLDPKTKLLEKAVSIPDAGEFMGAVPALKPPNGWPAGSYRVELYLGDALSKTLAFKVSKRA